MFFNTPDEESLANTKRLVATLDKYGMGDYSLLHRQIALDVYMNGFWAGDWDVTFVPSDYNSDLPPFRVVQEDEFDNTMDMDDFENVIKIPNGYLVI